MITVYGSEIFQNQAKKWCVYGTYGYYYTYMCEKDTKRCEYVSENEIDCCHIEENMREKTFHHQHRENGNTNTYMICMQNSTQICI